MIDTTNQSIINIWLVVYLPLWTNMKVSWDYYSQYLEKMFQITLWWTNIAIEHGHL